MRASLYLQCASEHQVDFLINTMLTFSISVWVCLTSKNRLSFLAGLPLLIATVINFACGSDSLSCVIKFHKICSKYSNQGKLIDHLKWTA